MLDFFGLTPPYPALGPTVARLRRSPDRHAHGAAVLDAIRTLQARDLAGALEPTSRPRCASGTAHTDGDRILAALRHTQAAALANTKARERTPEEWAAAYAEAMAERRAATISKSETVRPATHARPASVRAAPMLIPARTIVAPEINTTPCQVRATDCVTADLHTKAPESAQVAPDMHSRAHILTRVPVKRRPAMPPRPVTLPPAATVAHTWMTGAVGVSFAVGGW